jgi:multidrug efflux pump subunit AcrA (membrane-fusion protein)
VYVYDAASQSVVARPVTVSEVRGNEVIVSKGLSAGDRVAAAGVSYLRDGMKVKLLEPQL